MEEPDTFQVRAAVVQRSISSVFRIHGARALRIQLRRVLEMAESHQLTDGPMSAGSWNDSEGSRNSI
ncbi:hypothetical protein AJ88_13210 [Mesorhizobium amorphae CCBAU 01583]|nr:hypothetical protein AJ88_13210 [Mesorhizobium amorphae CCBAU 01583]